ncbi:ATP-binding protein [Marinobacter salinisoli]|uniref:histidine kinase n=1 Tax=Marinobacter salinisoli TaxID=2769486 RepID=A0ABX7MXX1_9GAMM|nr:ATP-binding protein [Marinobacter salinisoli]QSP96275.1 ATP-binding protein [Marinobacter salinisoli]
MSLTFFLKLYARFAGLMVLVMLLCVALFVGVNAVRSMAWHEHFPEPLMRWLIGDPDLNAPEHWLHAGYDFRILSPEEAGLEPVIMERLGYNQVVSLETGVGYRVLAQTDDGRVIQVRFPDLYRGVSEATAMITLRHLDSAMSADRATLAQQLADALAVDIRRVAEPESLPSDEVLEQVLRRGVVFFEDDSDDRGHVLMQLSDGELFRLDMAAPFDPWALPVIFLLVIAVGGVLAAVLVLALREVDNNLRMVESVVVRIARGEMGARVESGSGTLVSRLAASFNGMAEHIQRLVQVQREMIHAVSHELRTPVARIRFGVQMIESCEDEKKLEKQLEGIDGDIQELDELIDEILTYARLEQGGPVFSLQEASVTDLVRQVVSEQQLIRPALTIDADIDEGAEQWAMADIEPRYIHRAIQNLVGNAGRYAAGRVRVHCHIDEDNCRVDVEDDGPGIPEEDWEKVFTAFARLDDSRTRTSGGYGLGLSIVRRILYWHGGQAFVGRSEVLGGARFSLVWPRKKPVDSIV